MRYEIIEVGQECGEVEYQVSDVHPNGERTHSYDFQTLVEAEECLEELNKINITTKGNNMKKKLVSFAILGLIGLTLMFISSPAEAWFKNTGCDADCKAFEKKRADDYADYLEGQKPASDKHKAEVAAHNEALVKKHKESGNKDIDVINPAVATFLGTDGPTYEERMAELCFKDTWYGRKQIECVNK